MGAVASAVARWHMPLLLSAPASLRRRKSVSRPSLANTSPNEELAAVSLLVVGSVAYDAIETPFGKVDRTLGGAASYFSVAASFFAPVKLVAVVGEDFAP